MKIKSLIIDDEIIAREGLMEYAGKVDFIELTGACKNAIEANSFLQRNEVDLLFLDIRMPEISGMEWLKSLSNPPLTIITTAFRDYAAEGFDLEVIDYLVKPISFQRFLKACNKALKELENRENIYSYHDPGINSNFFFIKHDQQYVKLLFNDILFVEGLKDYVAIHTKTKKYLALISLKNVQGKLPKTHFVRVHRSFIIALDKIDAVEGNTLRIKDNIVPISREMQEEVYQIVLQDKLWRRSD
jgi:DNA-binding LytR/AlgR family response regulator